MRVADRKLSAAARHLLLSQARTVPAFLRALRLQGEPLPSRRLAGTERRPPGEGNATAGRVDMAQKAVQAAEGAAVTGLQGRGS
jgi:hypothetical protein